MSDELVSLPADQETTSGNLIPGYYLCLVATAGFDVDQLVYLLDVDETQVTVVRGDRERNIGRAAFTANFAFDPNGAVHRATEVGSLMTEIAELQQTGLRQHASFAQFNPHVDEAGSVEGMALVPAGGQGALDAKRSIATMRNEATKLRGELDARQQAIKAFAEEQAIILRRQAGELAAILKTAEEAVWTINLYLGSDEEIFRLAEGAPAPADTPITIRQLVLYMDEECAVAADEGGIDARSIDDFDAWLTSDPAHLAQVLPEPKGMVALKPRRKRRDYGDPWMNKAMDEANRKTYFLLRNGDNLYRMWTSYEVGERLIPRTDEFLGFFTERRRNWDTGQDETIQFKPGSDSFMRAEKQAEQHKRHYMRAALILQGLIDRTPIFLPLAEKINVGDQASYERALSVVLDADMMLSDGRERFADWFRRINGELTVGQRIVGSFNSWEHGLRAFDREKHYDGNQRISPTRAGYPDDDTLYTIEEKRGSGFVIRFARGGERWDAWGSAAYQKRATCIIEPRDKFILNFDAATVEEMEFFLHSRLDREAYSYLFPTLKLAIKLKHAEEAEEAPFGLLLAGEIAKAHGVDVATASAAVPELIRWWKFKNRTHRALTADDARALRMIVAEYGHRAAQGAIRKTQADTAEKMLATILAAAPDALLVAHKSGAEYVALIPENDENIFVQEQVWTTRGHKDTKRWRVVDTRRERWHILHTAPRFADWRTDLVRAEHLTDPEREDLLLEGWRNLRVKRMWRDEVGTPRDTTPLAATVDPDGTLQLYFVDGPGVVAEHLLTQQSDEPPLGRAKLVWKRDAKRHPVIEYMPESHISIDSWSFGTRRASGRTELPWENKSDGSPYAGKVLWRDKTAIAGFRSALADAKMVKREIERLRTKANQAISEIEAAYMAGLEAAAYEKFIADFGDPELWEGHRKTLRFGHADTVDIRHAINLLVERGIDIAGVRVADILDQARLLTTKKLKADDDLLELRTAG